eukprot:1687577-Rhodomonas_salina.1
MIVTTRLVPFAASNISSSPATATRKSLSSSPLKPGILSNEGHTQHTLQASTHSWSAPSPASRGISATVVIFAAPSLSSWQAASAFPAPISKRTAANDPHPWKSP